MASAWRLVSLAANLQPALPVQATMPARAALARAVSPAKARALSTAGSLPAARSAMMTFCHTVSRSAALRRNHHAQIGGKVAVAGDTAHGDTEVDLPRCTHRTKADVVGVLERGNPTAAIKGDVELARQTVELAVVENRVVEREAERPS